MDRRFKDYYIVTFKIHRDYYSWGGGYQVQHFCHFPRPIKVHWKSINEVPYALVSVDKDVSGLASLYFEQTTGVDKVIFFTEAKEQDWKMWQKILRLPENDYVTKNKMKRCMQQDLFMEWLV